MGDGSNQWLVDASATARKILMILACVFFALATFGGGAGIINVPLVPAGLFCLALSLTI